MLRRSSGYREAECTGVGEGCGVAALKERVLECSAPHAWRQGDSDVKKLTKKCAETFTPSYLYQARPSHVVFDYISCKTGRLSLEKIAVTKVELWKNHKVNCFIICQLHKRIETDPLPLEALTNNARFPYSFPVPLVDSSIPPFLFRAPLGFPAFLRPCPPSRMPPLPFPAFLVPFPFALFFVTFFLEIDDGGLSDPRDSWSFILLPSLLLDFSVVGLKLLWL